MVRADASFLAKVGELSAVGRTLYPTSRRMFAISWAQTLQEQTGCDDRSMQTFVTNSTAQPAEDSAWFASLARRDGDVVLRDGSTVRVCVTRPPTESVRGLDPS